MAIVVKKNLLSASKYGIKSPYPMDAKYITVHNTANDASAAAEISYMIGNNAKVSYHYAVDDKEVIQGLPVDRIAYHCGDGVGAKSGNRTSIGVEICYSKSGGAKYDAAEELAVKFVAQLLEERGWGIERVRKHQEWSGKFCPHRILAEGRWEAFKAAVAKELSEGAKKTSVTPPKTEVAGVVEKKPTGDDIIRTIQKKFGATCDGIYGPATKKALLKALQKEIGVKADGIWGAKTKAGAKTVKSGARGNLAYILQAALYCEGFNPKGVDGIIGANTVTAVKAFQKAYKLKADGLAGKNTWEAMFK